MIIIRKDNNVVVYNQVMRTDALGVYSLDPENPFRDLSLPEGARIVYDIDLPEGLIAGQCTYDGENFAPTLFKEVIPSWVQSEQREIAAIIISAIDLLDRSDLVVLRCYENSVPVPIEWKEYRDKLRSIISNHSTISVIPTHPKYPEGT